MTKNEARVLALELRKNENTMLESEKTIKAIVESNIILIAWFCVVMVAFVEPSFSLIALFDASR